MYKLTLFALLLLPLVCTTMTSARIVIINLSIQKNPIVYGAQDNITAKTNGPTAPLAILINGKEVANAGCNYPCYVNYSSNFSEWRNNITYTVCSVPATCLLPGVYNVSAFTALSAFRYANATLSVTGSYQNVTPNLALQSNRIAYGTQDVIMANSFVQSTNVTIFINGLAMSQGRGNAAYVICSSNTTATCLAPGMYNITAKAQMSNASKSFILNVYKGVPALSLYPPANYTYNGTPGNVSFGIKTVGNQLDAVLSGDANGYTNSTATALTGYLPGNYSLGLYSPGNTNYTYAGLSAKFSIYPVVNTIKTGVLPTAIAVDTCRDYVYVANYGSNTLSVINGTAVIANLSVGAGPQALVFDRNNCEMYSADFAASEVTAVAGLDVIGNMSVGSNPVALAFDNATNSIYSADYGSDEISVINTLSDSLQTNIGVGRKPIAILYNPIRNLTYVANFGSNNVSISNGVAVVNSVDVGVEPDALAYNSTGCVYVANYGSATVSVICGLQTSTIPNVMPPAPPQPGYGSGSGGPGVPFGDNGASGSAVCTSQNCYTINPSRCPDCIDEFPPSIIVDTQMCKCGNQTAVVVDLIPSAPFFALFTKNYLDATVADVISQLQAQGFKINDFNASGMANPAVSYTVATTGVDFNNGFGIPVSDDLVNLSNGNPPYLRSLSLLGQNGIALLTPIFYSVGARASPAADGVARMVIGTLNDGRLAMPIDYTFMMEPNWYFFSPPPAYIPLSVGSIYQSAGPGQMVVLTIAASAPANVPRYALDVGGNFALPYIVGLNEPSDAEQFNYSRNVSSNTVYAAAPETMSVAFSETGLGAGAVWGVTINGTTLYSNSTSLVFQGLRQGSYTYSVNSVRNYTAIPPGSLTINCSNLTVGIAFQPEPHTVTFVSNRTGIGSWGISLSSGQSLTTASDSVQFKLYNGQYKFSAVPPIGFSALPAMGNFTVNGTNVTIEIGFRGTYANMSVNAIKVGKYPIAELFDPQDCLLYVANYGSGTVSVISGPDNIGNITVGLNPRALALSTSTGWVYVADRGSGTVSVINMTRLIATIPVGPNPSSITYDPLSGLVYVADQTNLTASVTVIRGLDVIDGLAAGSGTVVANGSAVSLTYNPCTGQTYQLNSTSGILTVMNATLYHAPTAMISVSNSVIGYGGFANFTATVTNGFGPFTLSLEEGNGNVVQTLNNITQGTVAFSPFHPPSGLDVYRVAATDRGVLPSHQFTSANLTVDVASLLEVFENAVGGPLSPDNFTIDVVGNDPTPSTFNGSSSGVQVSIFAGNYVVNTSMVEFSNFSFYSQNFTPSCIGNIHIGQAANCTVTSTYTVPLKLSATLASNTDHVKLGQSISFVANMTGGRPDYAYSVLVKNTTTHGRFVYTGQNGTSTDSSITFIETPQKLGSSFYMVNITDSLGMRANATVHIVASR